MFRDDEYVLKLDYWDMLALWARMKATQELYGLNANEYSVLAKVDEALINALKNERKEEK